MLDLKIIPHSYSKIKKQILVECSDIGGFVNNSFITVLSPKTNNKVIFRFNKTLKLGVDEDIEVVGWEYVITETSLLNFPSLTGLSLMILND